MRTKVYSTNRQQLVEVDIENVTYEQYEIVVGNFKKRLTTMKNYEAIAETYKEAIELCPGANPSDLWRHLVYRPYLEINGDQSWKRAGGQALEVFFADFYNAHLSFYGIQIVVLSRATSISAFQEMGILDKVGKSKLDIVLTGQCNNSNRKVFGGIHVKASIAERIADDIPASQAMMNAGFFTGLATLDMKAFPPPHGDEVNRGELQFPQRANDTSDKRNYFERDGLFHACYSYNLRTPPSINSSVLAPIRTLKFSDPKPDMFMQDVIEAWEQRKNTLCK